MSKFSKFSTTELALTALVEVTQKAFLEGAQTRRAGHAGCECHDLTDVLRLPYSSLELELRAEVLTRSLEDRHEAGAIIGREIKEMIVDTLKKNPVRGSVEWKRQVRLERRGLRPVMVTG